MRRVSIAMGISAIALLAAVAAAPQTADRQGPAGAARVDDATTGTTLRASQITGMNIQNLEGESLGSVDDIVIDAETGEIRYLAVSYGGFLGLGDKLFAVPWRAFEVRRSDAAFQDYHLVLDVPQERLENAQGFDKDNWPNFADRRFTDAIDKHYGVEIQTDRRRGEVDVRIRREGADADRATRRTDRVR